MPLTLKEFLVTGRGIQYKSAAARPIEIRSLSEDLRDLVFDTNWLSVTANDGSNERLLDGLQSLATQGTQLLISHGLMTREIGNTGPQSQSHDLKIAGVRLTDVFNALEKENEFHALCRTEGREPGVEKTPQDRAFRALGYLNSAAIANADLERNQLLALEFLKNAVAESVMALQEAPPQTPSPLPTLPRNLSNRLTVQ